MLRFRAVTNAQRALLPPALRQAGFFAKLVRVGEKDLAGDGEGFLILEPIQQRREESAFHPHVAIEQHHDIVLRGAEPGVGAASESEVLDQREHADLWKMFAHERGAAVFGAVVDDDDLAAGMSLESRRLPRADIFREGRGHSSWE